MTALQVRSCLIDGETVYCVTSALAIFALLRHRMRPRDIFLYAFDLRALDGQDLHREPLEVRKATLAILRRGGRPGLRISEQLKRGSDIVFRHDGKLGCEGIVSKWPGSRGSRSSVSHGDNSPA